MHISPILHQYVLHERIQMEQVNEVFPNQYFGPDLPDEEFRPCYYHGKEIPGYFVSQYGNVKGKQKRRLKWSRRNKTQWYPNINLYLPNAGYLEDFDRANTEKIRVPVHTLVANSFLPLTNETVPEALRGYNFDKTALEYIRSLLYIDHIDNDPTNPHVSNLRYVSPKENNPYYKAATYESSAK